MDLGVVTDEKQSSNLAEELEKLQEMATNEQ